jgi:hypothetical protein
MLGVRGRTYRKYADDSYRRSRMLRRPPPLSPGLSVRDSRLGVYGGSADRRSGRHPGDGEAAAATDDQVSYSSVSCTT